MKELLKFSKELKAFRQQGAYPQGDVKNALADIYEANWQKKWGVRKINRGCGSCIGDMMKCLCAEFESMQVEHKLVTVFEVDDNREDIPVYEMELADDNEDLQIALVNTEEYHAEPFHVIDTTDLTLGQLKEECDKRGIKYHHRAGVKKLTELLNGH